MGKTWIWDGYDMVKIWTGYGKDIGKKTKLQISLTFKVVEAIGFFVLSKEYSEAAMGTNLRA